MTLLTVEIKKLYPGRWYESKYSRVDQVKFMEDSL